MDRTLFVHTFIYTAVVAIIQSHGNNVYHTFAACYTHDGTDFCGKLYAVELKN